MLGIIFWVGVGIVIGWNLPQPQFAKELQARIVAKWEELTGKGDSSGSK